MLDIKINQNTWKGYQLPDDRVIHHFAHRIQHSLEQHSDVVALSVDSAIYLIEHMIILHSRAAQAENRASRISDVIDILSRTERKGKNE
jgi:hypothetical protein